MGFFFHSLTLFYLFSRVDTSDGIRREFEVTTLKTTLWHILEKDHIQLPLDSYGQFHDGDTYVVRWLYMITACGLKSSRFGNAARERTAYFFWQGRDSSISEKGASALMTIELDEERGPQVRVEQGKEPPCFLNLFEGTMIVHIGHREDANTNTEGDWRLYACRGEMEGESYLLEVPCVPESLRSRSSFLLLNVKTGLIQIWHGCKSPKYTKTIAYSMARNIFEKTPIELCVDTSAVIKIIELNEGNESTLFWTAMNEKFPDRTKYDCLLDGK